jgi:streptogramin lyase
MRSAASGTSISGSAGDHDTRIDPCSCRAAVVPGPDPVRLALPKTISGKIRRVRLRTVEAERRQKNEKQEWEFFEEDSLELKS